MHYFEKNNTRAKYIIRGSIIMLKDIMWNLFQNTGSIRSYVLYKEIIEREKFSKEHRISFEQTATTNIS